MKDKFNRMIRLLKRTAGKFKKDNPVQLAGTTAYFAVFAMAPLIIIIVSVAGILLGQEEIQAKLFEAIDSILGEQPQKDVRNIVENFQDQRKGIIGTIVGFIIFIFISTTFFSILQKSLKSRLILSGEYGQNPGTISLKPCTTGLMQQLHCSGI